MGRPDLALPMFEAGWRRRAEHLRAARRRRFLGRARASAASRDPAGYVPWMQRAADRAPHLLRPAGPPHPRPRYRLRPARAGTRAKPSARPTSKPSPPPRRACAPSPCCRSARTTAPKPNCAGSGPPRKSAPALGRALMLVAAQAGLADLAAQLADQMQSADGRPRDDMRFPLPRLRPSGGFRIDPALVYGMTRTESELRRRARLPGRRARPDADHARHRQLHHRRAATASLRAVLLDPSVNLDLGQRYVAYLAELRGDRRRPPAPARQLQRRPRHLRPLGRHPPRRRRPAAVHRGDPARRNPRLRAARADLHLDLRRPAAAAHAEPRRTRRRRLAALSSARTRQNRPRVCTDAPARTEAPHVAHRRNPHLHPREYRRADGVGHTDRGERHLGRHARRPHRRPPATTSPRAPSRRTTRPPSPPACAPGSPTRPSTW